MKKNVKLLISTAIIAHTFSVPQPIHGMEDITIPMEDFSQYGDQKAPSGLSESTDDLVDHCTVKTIVEKHLNSNSNLLNSSHNKDIVVFLGNTGSGKSTLVNHLSNRKLVVNEYSEIVLNDPNDPFAMEIGCGSSSTTFLPKCIQVGGLLFYDLPGFKDTRGTATSLVNACFIKRIIENARSVKLVFVAGLEEIKTKRGRGFIKFLKKIQQLIPNKPIENFSSLIVTKTNWIGEQLIDNIRRGLSPEIERNLDLSILKFWINHKRLGWMHQPITKERIYDEDFNDKAHNIKIITEVGYEKIEDVNIGLIYNNENQNDIIKIYNEEIVEIVEQLYQEKHDNLIFSSLSIQELEDRINFLKEQFCNIALATFEEKPMIKLLAPISSQAYTDTRNNLEEVANKKIEDALTRLNLVKKFLKDIDAHENGAKKMNKKMWTALKTAIIIPTAPVALPVAGYFYINAENEKELVVIIKKLIDDIMVDDTIALSTGYNDDNQDQDELTEKKAILPQPSMLQDKLALWSFGIDTTIDHIKDLKNTNLPHEELSKFLEEMKIYYTTEALIKCHENGTSGIFRREHQDLINAIESVSVITFPKGYINILIGNIRDLNLLLVNTTSRDDAGVAVLHGHIKDKRESIASILKSFIREKMGEHKKLSGTLHPRWDELNKM